MCNNVRDLESISYYYNISMHNNTINSYHYHNKFENSYNWETFKPLIFYSTFYYYKKNNNIEILTYYSNDQTFNCSSHHTQDKIHNSSLRQYIAGASGDVNEHCIITTNIISQNNKHLFENLCQFEVHKDLIGVSWLESVNQSDRLYKYKNIYREVLRLF